MELRTYAKHRGWRWGWILPCLLALAGVAHAAPQAPVPLDAATPQLALAPHTRYLHDGAGTMDAPRAWAEVEAGAFSALPHTGAAFGFQQGAYWFHIPLQNRDRTQPHWLLVQDYPLSDRLDLYVRYADGRVVHRSGGDHLPFDARSVDYRYPNFMLDLPADERVDVLLRVQSQSSMQVPLTLHTPQAFIELSRDAQFGIGLYYGILVALFFYNLVLWLSLRDASYFWYLFHLSAFGLVLMTLNGLGFEYLWPRSPWLADLSVPLSICLAQIGMQQFARVFLRLSAVWTTGNVISLGVIAFYVVLGLASFWLPYRIATPLASASVFLSIAWILTVTLVAYRRGDRSALLFLLAWGMFLLGTGMFTALAFGLLPKSFLTVYGVQIGSALEMLLLSIALSYRYAALRNENERIVRRAKLQLESQVLERTSELRTALEQLETAHARLREASRHDALTGLYNRAWFRERFESLLEAARTQGQPLSLLMVDLDHFKQINDRHGHLVGDDCLRRCARVIEGILRGNGALVARYGGEEFIAALPGIDIFQARELAEEVCTRLREEPIRTRGPAVTVTASIGVHAVDTGAEHEDAATDLALQVVDNALYAAKSGGRDQVRVADR
ncbi:sensor domain-containing diguanylate cyclase [Pseudoxanthomonas sp. 10H]|uniref:sensor domain-containing diguanylate cyclase n=1 Tax=Pseudoxanthomonas sp. 10H TaxID=3242729 RepID=UPI003558EE5A